LLVDFDKDLPKKNQSTIGKEFTGFGRHPSPDYDLALSV
jgi:hypothetical protein